MPEHFFISETAVLNGSKLQGGLLTSTSPWSVAIHYLGIPTYNSRGSCFYVQLKSISDLKGFGKP
jgi:hypothetical protein